MELYQDGRDLERYAKLVDGSSVKDGYIGYCRGKEITLPKYDDKEHVDQVYKDGVNLAVYDHEKNHAKDPGASELEVEVKSILETKNPVLRMFKDALLNIGIGQGRKEAKDAARETGFIDRMKDYLNSELKPVFEEITYNTAVLLGMKPEYAYARVEVD